eukprot:6205219-Pleurochrysis_carterae.AAC.1
MDTRWPGHARTQVAHAHSDGRRKVEASRRSVESKRAQRVEQQHIHAPPASFRADPPELP